MNDQFFQQKNERKYIRLTQCYDQLYDELFRMEAHAHEGIELMFVREGRINFFFSVGGMVKQYSIAADEFVIFDSTIPHRLEVEKCAHILNFQIKLFDEGSYRYQPPLGALIASAPEYQLFSMDEYPCFKEYDDADILPTLDKMVRISAEYVDVKYVLIEHYLSALLFEVSVLHHKHVMRYKGYSYVRRAVEYIENSNERIGAEKLAELSGISYVYLHKLFKKCFDKGISGYINEFYINRAASMIGKYPYKSIEQICEMCGFTSARAFERQFKKIKGVSPAKYKAMAHESKRFYLRDES